MFENNIYETNNKFHVKKIINGKSVIFASLSSFDDAVFVRNLLVKYNWDMEKIRSLGHVFSFNNYWAVVYIQNGKFLIAGKYPSKMEAQLNAEKFIKKFDKNSKKTDMAVILLKI